MQATDTDSEDRDSFLREAVATIQQEIATLVQTVKMLVDRSVDPPARPPAETSAQTTEELGSPPENGIGASMGGVPQKLGSVLTSQQEQNLKGVRGALFDHVYKQALTPRNVYDAFVHGHGV